MRSVASLVTAHTAWSAKAGASVNPPHSIAFVMAMAVVVDGVAVVAATALVSGSWHLTNAPSQLGHTILLAIIASAVTLAVMSRRAATLDLIRNPYSSLSWVIGPVTWGMVALAVSGTLLGTGSATMAVRAVLWAAATTTAVELGRVGQARLIEGWINSGRLIRRTAVVGNAAEVERIARQFHPEANRILRVTGGYDDRATSGASLAALIDAARRNEVDEVIIAIEPADHGRVLAAVAALRSLVIEVHLVTEINRLGLTPAFARFIANTHTVAVHCPPLSTWAHLQKGIFDRMLAGVLLLALSPVLAAAAIAVKANSHGPVFFRQPRIGYNNRPFLMYKFRSMFADMSDIHAAQQTAQNDPRVTSVGRIVRKYSIDELPQLINVLLGDMSLVGPRPHAMSTRAEGLSLEEAEADYELRHRVRPGITGWAQVNGSRGELRTAEQVRIRVAHDLYYIKNWTLALDLKIMVLTVLREVSSKRAY